MTGALDTEAEIDDPEGDAAVSAADAEDAADARVATSAPQQAIPGAAAAPAPPPAAATQAVPAENSNDAIINPVVDRLRQAGAGGDTPAPSQNGPARVTSAANPPAGAPGAPTAAVPGAAAASSPTPTVVKPQIDPRPLMLLEDHAPKYFQLVTKIAEENGISPERLALHWQKEGGFRLDAETSEGDAAGALQMTPATQREVDPRGLLDPHNLVDSLTMAARHIRQLDGEFGKDSVASMAAYQGGRGSVRDIVAHPEQAEQAHPRTFAYARDGFVNHHVTPADFTGGTSGGSSQEDAQNLIRAGSQGGPDGFLRQAMATAPRGMGPSDVFRNAEMKLSSLFAMRGDVAGMQHVRDWVTQMSQAGSTQYLMAAHRSLTAGDTASAVQYLAKAHAFFPDDTIGYFGVDARGQVWGERVDEHDPSRIIGSPFQVTPDAIATMMQQTSNPQAYIQAVRQQQMAAAQARRADAQANYFSGRNATSAGIAAGHDDASVTNTALRTAQSGENAQVRASSAIDTANARERATVDAARTRADAQGGNGAAAQNQLAARVDREVTQKFNDLAADPDISGASPQQKAVMGTVYREMRMGGAAAPAADMVAKGLATNQMHLLPMTDGSYAVAGKDGKPITYISGALAQRLAGGRAPAPTAAPQPGAASQPQSPSPVGGGAGTSYARGAGMGSDLTGTTQPHQQAPQRPPANQSSAIPTEQSSAVPTWRQ